MKRLFLFAMMCLFGLFGSINAQTVDLVIGEEGTTSSANVPFYTYYNYSISQQIYTADEMWNLSESTISTIGFKQFDSSVRTRNIAIYLLNTDRTSFTYYGSDWEPVTEADLVFSGQVTTPGVAGAWMDIELQTPFHYTGGNVLVCVLDNTGSWVSASSFYTYNAGYSVRNMYAFRDPSAYDPANPGVSGNHSMDWASGNYRNNVIKFNATVPADFASLTVAPEVIDLGARPNGAWMRPAEVVVGTKAFSLDINAVEPTDSYFQVSDVEYPAHVTTKESLPLEIAHGEAEGTVNAQLAISYNNSRAIELVDMTAFAYNPAANDVFETAEEIASYPFSATPDMETVYDNYQLPGYEQDGDDVVYAMEFDNDVVLSANVTGYNGKVAVYTEDFAGKEGPMADNNYEGPEVGYAPIPAPTKFSYDFEWANTDGWDIIDADEDGYKWQSSYYTLGYPGGFGHNSEFCMTSLSYAYMPLDPDNYMVTEEKYSIFPTSELSFWVATAAMYPSEHYGVAVSTDGENFTTIYEETYGEWKGGERNRDQDNGLSDWKQVVVSLADYAGQEIYVAIRHFNSADNYVLCVDDIELSKYGAKRGNAINEMVLPAGKYYVAASSTEAFTLNVNAETIPVPEKAYNPSPANGAQGLQDPNLSWTFGKYTVEYQLLFGTTYPPKEVYVDWTDNLEIGHVIRDLYNNKNYFWQVNARNSSGTTYGDVWGFTTTLNVPTDLALTSADIYEGETTTLSWEAVADRSHRGYNVYVNGEKYNNSLITETSYELAGLPYNMNGHQISVSAFYDEGESALSNPVYVYVTGMTEIAGQIFEQDGTTPIAGGTISINGTDEIGNSATYTFQADATGAYSGEILAGNYIATAIVDLYQNKDVEIVAEYGKENIVNFNMTEVFNPVKYVDVTIINSSNPDPDPEDPDQPEDPEQPETDLYRIKTSAGQYLHVFNNTEHQSGPFGGVGVADYSDSNAQLFEIEENGSNVYLKSADGYYVKCWAWNVDAYSTTDKTALVMEDNGNGTFRIKNTDNYKYFKVEYVADGGQTFVFGDCDGSNGTIENWTLEPVQTRDGDAVQVVWGMQKYGGGGEDFETGDFSANEWNNTVSEYPWVVVEGGNESNYAMRSDCAGIDYGISAIEITVEVPFDGFMSFDYKISSEQAYDLGKFYIDGTTMATFSGEAGWATKKVAVTEGVHVYRWEYSKDVMWEGGEDAFYVDNIEFCFEPEPFTGGWLTYDDGVYATSIGTGQPSPCYWGISFPAKAEYAGYTIDKVAVYDASPDYAGSYTVNIYLGGDNAPGTLVSSQTATLTGVGDYVEIALDTPVAIDGTQMFWITFYTADLTFPAAGCSYAGDSNSDWISLDGMAWDHAGPTYGLEYTWMIRAYMNNAKGETAVLGNVSFEGGASTGTFAAAENVTPKHVGMPEVIFGQQTAQNEGTRAFSSYNLYKKSLYAAEPELLLQKTADTSYIDATWATAEPGVYQWGVGVIYEGNRAETVFSENFNNGMPAGWTVYNEGVDDWWYSWGYGSNGTWYVSDQFQTGYSNNYHAYEGTSAMSYHSYLYQNMAMYLVTPVMEIKANSTLSFMYTNPYWGSDYNRLRVHVSNSPTGPWTEVWSTGDNATTQTDDEWLQAVVDLKDYAGAGQYIAFCNYTPNSYGGWGVAIDNVSISAEASESEILWSDPLDKDMNTTVTVSAMTDSGDPVSGTKITFVNTMEQGVVYEATLGSENTVTFDNFRKGTYELTVAKNGFISDYDAAVVEIWEASQFNAFLTEDPAPVEDLYVSPTGWAMWKGAGIGAGDEFSFDFESDIQGWTTIDADGDGYDWTYNNSISIATHDGSIGSVYSESYNLDYQMVLNPDNYLVSPQKYLIGGSSVLKFWACAQDAAYPSEHFGVAVSANGNTNGSDFTTIAEWTMTAKDYQGPKDGPRGSRATGNWYEYSVDMSEYAGQEVYIAIRHFNCSDMFYIVVDDITMTNAEKSDRALLGYTVMLDGNIEAEGLTVPYYQHENVMDAVEYTTTVIASYSMGDSDEMSYTWTKVAESVFAGVSELDAQYKNEAVELTWSFGGDEPTPDGQTYNYNFESGLDGWTNIDADGDGNVWQHNVAYGLTGEGSMGNNGSTGFAFSQSYINYVGAINPDNYLVSPQKYAITAGSKISFYASAQDESYPYEHFALAVSSAGNTSASDFTSISEWTFAGKGTCQGERSLRQTAWVKYEVDLSEYAGQELWLAIRHFDCTDQYFLDIDDIEVVVGGGGNDDDDDDPIESMSWDFESGLDGWTSIDADGDAYAWDHNVDYGLTGDGAYGNNGSTGFVFSQSYDNYFGPLYPDNYLVSPSKIAVAAGTKISFYACAQDESYGAEHFGVAVSTAGNTSGSDFTTISEWTISAKGDRQGDRSLRQSSWVKYEADLSAYAGQEVYVAIRHFNCSDQYFLDIDDIAISTSKVADRDAMSWSFDNDFEGWTTINANGDDHTWYHCTEAANHGTLAADPHSGAGHLMSESYCNWTYAAIQPDDYVVAPQKVLVNEGDVVSFWACSQDSEFAAEHFGVAVSTGSNTSAADFTTISEWTVGAKGTAAKTGKRGTRGEQTTWVQYTASLNEYAGQEVWVAIRHFNCYDQFILLIDDVTISAGGENPDPNPDPDPTENVLGVMIYKNGELLTSKPVEGTTYTDKNGIVGDEYCVRVVYAGEPDVTYYAMSEPTCAEADVIIDCVAPVDLFAEQTGNDEVTLKLSYNPNPVGEWLYYDNGTNEDAIGLQGGGSFHWGIMFPSESLAAYAGASMTKVSMFDYTAHSGNINIYYGGTTAPGDLVHSQPYTSTGTGDFVEFDLTSALPLDETQNVWVTFNNNDGQYVAAVCANTGDANGRWISTDGVQWMDLVSAGLSNTWMVRAYVTTDVKGELPSAPVELINNANGGTPVKVGAARATSELTHYNVYRGTSENNMTVIGETSTKTYVDSDVAEGTYYYAMTAVYEEGGETCESDPANAYGSDETFVVVTVTSIDENGVEGMMIYPNPTKDNVTISAEGIERITITNALGQVMLDRVVNSDSEILNMGQYEAGVYMVRIVTANGVATERITVL